MKNTVVCILSLLLCCYANAQSNNVVVELNYLDYNPALAKNVSNTLSDMFTELYSAWENHVQPDLNQLYITDATKKKIAGLWARHKFRLAGMSCILGTAKIYGENEYAVFSVPMQMENEYNSVEYTIQFDTCGVITNFERSEFPILNFQTGKRVVDEHTSGIIKVILYQLRKAYQDKNMAYLRKIYDPDGYCVVGKKTVTKTANSVGNEIRIYLEETYYELTIKKLHEYLDDLQSTVFDKNAWVNPIFGEPEITAHQNPNQSYEGIYYINVFQDYRSQTYNDKGWLTFVLDLRDKSNPQIMARIWLPKKITNEELTGIL